MLWTVALRRESVIFNGLFGRHSGIVSETPGILCTCFRLKPPDQRYVSKNTSRVKLQSSTMKRSTHWPHGGPMQFLLRLFSLPPILILTIASSLLFLVPVSFILSPLFSLSVCHHIPLTSNFLGHSLPNKRSLSSISNIKHSCHSFLRRSSSYIVFRCEPIVSWRADPLSILILILSSACQSGPKLPPLISEPNHTPKDPPHRQCITQLLTQLHPQQQFSRIVPRYRIDRMLQQRHGCPSKIRS